MADTKVSAFTSAASVDGTETVPILQGGANKKVLLSAVVSSYLDTLYQPLDTDLTALAGLASAADKVPYFTGAGTASVADFTAAGRALMDDANAAAQCTTLGLGTGNSPVWAGATLKATSPSLAVIDSDTVDADAGVSIAAAATTTTAGAEDVDLTITQQVAGSPANVLVADADGSITLGDGIRAVYIAKLNSLVPVTANTGAATPANTDSGTVFSNEGDSDGSSVTLPTAVAGLQFTICVQTNQTLTVTANSGDTIRIGSSATSAAGSITSNVIGSSVTLVAINATEWFATASVGSWSF